MASEDIGNADPQALLIAHAAFRSAEVIGYPECRINLAQAVIYMALAPKSNAAEAGIDAALHEVRTGPRREVPSYLRDRTRPGSEEYGNYRLSSQIILGDGLNSVIFQKDLNVVRSSRHLQEVGKRGELQLQSVTVTRKSRILNYLSGSIKRTLLG